jgi:hypothetical protein
MTINFSKSLEIFKEKTKVLILGAYSSPKKKDQDMEIKAEERLKLLKSSLISKGFVLTKLVKDWPDEKNIPENQYDVHFRDKSFYYMRNWADILVFVFFEDCNNNSVCREWGHMIDSITDKIDQSIILRHESIDLGCLLKGDIKDNRVFEAGFSTNNELFDNAFSGCISSLYRLYRTKTQ